MKVSKTGYKKNSKDKNEESLLIPSNRITMKNVEFPVYGVDDTGYSQMMYPGSDYTFPGNYVYELPVKKGGGHIVPGRYRNPEGNWLNKYQSKTTTGQTTKTSKIPPYLKSLPPLFLEGKVEIKYDGVNVYHRPMYGNPDAEYTVMDPVKSAEFVKKYPDYFPPVILPMTREEIEEVKKKNAEIDAQIAKEKKEKEDRKIAERRKEYEIAKRILKEQREKELAKQNSKGVFDYISDMYHALPDVEDVTGALKSAYHALPDVEDVANFISAPVDIPKAAGRYLWNNFKIPQFDIPTIGSFGDLTPKEIWKSFENRVLEKNFGDEGLVGESNLEDYNVLSDETSGTSNMQELPKTRAKYGPQRLPARKDSKGALLPAYQPIGGNDSLARFTYTFNNDITGADSLPPTHFVTPKIKELTGNPARPKKWENSFAVGDFLRDADITENQYYHPDKYYVGSASHPLVNSDLGIQSKKLISASNQLVNDPEKYWAVYKWDPKNPGAAWVRYLKTNEIKSKKDELLKQGWHIDMPVSGQHKFDDVDWDGKGSDTGYKADSEWVPLKKGASQILSQKGAKHTFIPQGTAKGQNKGTYNLFSGGSITFIWKDPVTNERLASTLAGSISDMKLYGEKLKKDYGLKDGELEIIYHDTGSYSAKPAAKNGTLYYDQWKNYNSYNKGYSGAALIVPTQKWLENWTPNKKQGGQLNQFQKGGSHQRIYTDPEEFKIANQAYQDSLEGFRKFPLLDSMQYGFSDNDISRPDFSSYNDPDTGFTNILNRDFANTLSICPSNMSSTCRGRVWVYKRPTEEPVYQDPDKIKYKPAPPLSVNLTPPPLRSNMMIESSPIGYRYQLHTGVKGSQVRVGYYKDGKYYPFSKERVQNEIEENRIPDQTEENYKKIQMQKQQQLKRHKTGGPTNKIKLQKGGIPMPTIVNDPTAGRSYYDPIGQVITIGTLPFGVNPRDVREHELFHHLQNINGGLHLGTPAKRPAITSTEENAADYFNRKNFDVDNIIDEFNYYNPSFQFVPNQVIYDKYADDAQYNLPWTVEGEAQDYENYIKSGGKSMFKKNGGWLDKYQPGGSALTKGSLSAATFLPTVKTITSYLNPYNWGVPDYSDYKTFSEAFTAARKAGEKEFMWNGNRYNSRKDTDPIKFVNDDPRGEEYNKMLRTTYPELLKYLNKGININAIEFKGVPESSLFKIKKNPERANYNSSDRIISIGENPIELYAGLTKIIAETAHLKDPKLKSSFNEIFNYTDDQIKRIFIGEDVYNTPGHLEYNTHRLYEPGIAMMAHFNLSPKDIKRIQKFLGVDDDGIFGEQTYRALRNKYKDHPEVKRWEEVSREAYNDKQPDLINPPILTYMQLLNEDVPIKSLSAGSYFDDYPAKGYTWNKNRRIPLIYTNNALLENSPEDMDPLLLQEALVARGYKLPKSTKKDGSLDAKLGDETRAALLDYQSKNKIYPYKGNYVPKAKETKKTFFKTGGWLDKYQGVNKGSQFSKYDIMSDVYADVKRSSVPVSTYVNVQVPTEKDIKTVQAEAQRVKKKMKQTGAKSEAEVYAKEQQEKQQEKIITDILASQGVIKPAEEKTSGDYINHAWDILKNPLTAARYKIMGQEIPWGFTHSSQGRNPMDYGVDVINPAFYASAAGRLLDAAITPETYTQVMPQTASAVLANIAGDQYPSEWDESAWKMLGYGLDALALRGNPFKIPRKYAIGYQSPSGGRAALGDLEYIAANNPKVLGSLNTPFGKLALAKANPVTETGLSRFTQQAPKPNTGAAAAAQLLRTPGSRFSLDESPQELEKFMVQARAAGAKGPAIPEYFTKDEIQLQSEQIQKYNEARKEFNKKYGPLKHSFDETDPVADWEMREELFKLLYPNLKIPDFNAKDYLPKHYSLIDKLLRNSNKSMYMDSPFAGRKLKELSRQNLTNRLLKDSVKEEIPGDFVYRDGLKKEALDPDSWLNTDPRGYLQEFRKLPENADKLSDQEIRDLAHRVHADRIQEAEKRIQKKHGDKNIAYNNLITTGKIPFAAHDMNSKASSNFLSKGLIPSSINAHITGLRYALKELMRNKNTRRPLSEIFPVTKASQQQILDENNKIYSLGNDFYNKWVYDDQGMIRPEVGTRIQNIIAPPGSGYTYQPNYAYDMDPTNPFITTPDKIVNTRNINSNKGLTKDEEEIIKRNRATALGVNSDWAPTSLTFNNFGYFGIPFRKRLETFIHEKGHTFQDFGEKFISSFNGNSPVYQSIPKSSWGKQLAKHSDEYKYFTPNLDTEIGRKFAEAMREPVKGKDNWSTSPTELHSELMVARFKLVEQFMKRGYSMDEAINIVKQESDEMLDYLIEAGNLDRFFKTTTSKEKKYELLRILPALIPLGLIGGLGAVSAPEEKKYKKYGGPIKWLDNYQDGSQVPQSWKDRYDWTPNVEEEYQMFKNDPNAPDNLRFTDDLNDYNVRGMWDSLERPSSWEQALTLYKDLNGEEWVPEEDGYYHGWSQHPGTGEWLKPKHHSTGWMNYIGYAFDPNTTAVVNPEGFFGNETLQAYPRKKKGGITSQGMGYFDYINGYRGVSS